MAKPSIKKPHVGGVEQFTEFARLLPYEIRHKLLDGYYNLSESDKKTFDQKYFEEVKESAQPRGWQKFVFSRHPARLIIYGGVAAIILGSMLATFGTTLLVAGVLIGVGAAAAAVTYLGRRNAKHDVRERSTATAESMMEYIEQCQSKGQGKGQVDTAKQQDTNKLKAPVPVSMLSGASTAPKPSKIKR